MELTNVTKGRKFQHALNAALMIIGIGGIAVGINWAAHDSYVRADLTEHKLHSLSPISKKAARADDPIKISFIRSEKFPKALESREQYGRAQIENVPRLVQALEDKLDEYVRASEGTLDVSVQSDELSKVASREGLTPLFLPAARSDEADAEALNKKYYLALKLSYRTVEVVIPLLHDPSTFEYDLTKALLRLRAKEAASALESGLLKDGEALTDAVDACVDAIADLDPAKGKAKGESEGSALTVMNRRVDAWYNGLTEIEAACAGLGAELEQRKARFESPSGGGAGRDLTREHMAGLLARVDELAQGIPAWSAAVVDHSWRRVPAGERFTRQPLYLASIRKMASHPTPVARAMAIRVLGGWLMGDKNLPALAGAGKEGAVEIVRKALSDSFPAVRLLALKFIVNTAQDRGAAKIREMVKDPDPGVQAIAYQFALALKLLPLEAVKPKLLDKDWRLRVAAIRYVAELEKSPVSIRPLLNDPNVSVQLQAARALIFLKDIDSAKAIQQVIRRLGQSLDAVILNQQLNAMMKGPAPSGAPPAPRPSPGAQPPTPAPAAQPPTPAPAATPTPPGGPGNQPPPGARRRRQQQGLDVDEMTGVRLPDPVEGFLAIQELKKKIAEVSRAMKDAPGRKSIGVLCGHGEFCPFETKQKAITPQQMQMVQQQGFQKNAVDTILRLEGWVNQLNEQLRTHFSRQGYRLVKVEPGKPIPSEIDALCVYGPRTAFSDPDLYDLDQFILTGKPVVLFLQNFTVSVNQWDEKESLILRTHLERNDTSLDLLLRHYGVENGIRRDGEVKRALVMESKKALRGRIRVLQNELLDGREVVTTARYQYPFFPVVESFSRTHPLVGGLKRLPVPFASAMAPAATLQEGLNVESLMRSSDDARAVIPTYEAKRDAQGEKVLDATGREIEVMVAPVLNPATAADAAEDASVTGPHDLALHVTGEGVPSFFAGRGAPARPKKPTKKDQPGQPPSPPEKEEPSPEPVNSGTVNLVVIGSVFGFEEMSADRFINDFNFNAILADKLGSLNAARPHLTRFMNTWARLVGTQNPVSDQSRGQPLPGQQNEVIRDGLAFIYGVFDWAIGDPGVAQIRNKRNDDRPLRIESETTRWIVPAGLVFGLPALLLLAAAGRFWLRRVRRRRYAQSMGGAR